MDCVQEWLRNKVCGWVPHPQINKNGKRKNCWWKSIEIIAFKKKSNKAINEKIVVFEIMLHYSFYILISKTQKS